MNLVANLQPAEQIVPAVGALDDPAAGLETRIALALLLFLPARLDVRDVAPTQRRATQLRVIVAFVTAQMLARLLLRRWPRHHHRIQRGAELFHVVPVGARERSGQGDAVGVREVVPLGAQLAPVGGISPGLVPPFTGAETVAESSDWKRQSMPRSSS
jgi:hypothetical protein